MMMKKLCCSVMLFGVLSMVFAPQLCYGNGFAIYEGSARGNALGGTLVGRADDPSALFYNPAGITQLPGLQMMIGATAITPSVDVVTAQGTTQTEDNWYFPPHFYTSYQVSDVVWVGLGVFSPFGLGTEFDDNWAGRYNNYNATLQTVSVNPNLAVKLTDKLSLAAGISAMWLDIKLEKKIDSSRFLGNPNYNNPNVSAFDVDSSLQGDTVGIGFNAAAHYKACDWLALGASYRSQVKQNISSADADFTKPSLALPAPLNQLYATWFNDTTASGTVTLPDMLSLGAVFRPLERLSVEIDGIWTRWSTYDELSFTFSNPIVVIPKPLTVVDRSITSKDWHDVWRIQVGAEYKVTDWFDFRLGYIWDESPVPDATVDYILPTDNRSLYSIGGGFHWQNWTVDVSYTYLDCDNRTITARQSDGILESEFKSVDANLIGLSLSYKF
jgi:long-chain fatty acid transport protein